MFNKILPGEDHRHDTLPTEYIDSDPKIFISLFVTQPAFVSASKTFHKSNRTSPMYCIVAGTPLPPHIPTYRNPNNKVSYRYKVSTNLPYLRIDVLHGGGYALCHGPLAALAHRLRASLVHLHLADCKGSKIKDQTSNFKS